MIPLMRGCEDTEEKLGLVVWCFFGMDFGLIEGGCW